MPPFWRGLFLWKYYGAHSFSRGNHASDLDHAQSFCRCVGQAGFLTHLPSRATFASCSPPFRLHSPKIRKKLRLFCRLLQRIKVLEEALPLLRRDSVYYQGQPMAGTGQKMLFVPFVFSKSRFQGYAFRCDKIVVILKGQSHELRMRDFLPLGALTQDHAVISRHYRYGFRRR